MQMCPIPCLFPSALTGSGALAQGSQPDALVSSWVSLGGSSCWSHTQGHMQGTRPDPEGTCLPSSHKNQRAPIPGELPSWELLVCRNLHRRSHSALCWSRGNCFYLQAGPKSHHLFP